MDDLVISKIGQYMTNDYIYKFKLNHGVSVLWSFSRICKTNRSYGKMYSTKNITYMTECNRKSIEVYLLEQIPDVFVWYDFIPQSTDSTYHLRCAIPFSEICDQIHQQDSCISDGVICNIGMSKSCFISSPAYELIISKIPIRKKFDYKYIPKVSNISHNDPQSNY